MNTIPRPLRLAAFLALSAVTLLAAPRAEANALPPPMVEVTGEGEMKVAPDQVVIRLGLETFGPRLKDVRQEMAERSQSLLAVLKTRGVKAADIQTEMVHISPHYDFDKAKRKFIEYNAKKSFVVTLNDIDIYGSVLEGALEAGVDRVEGVQFQSSNLKSLKDGARKAAVQDAKKRADLMAGALGQHAGKAIRIQEMQTDFPHPVMMRAAAMDNLRGGGVQDAIAPGEISVKSSVLVQFELK